MMKVICGFNDGHEVSEFHAISLSRDAISERFLSANLDLLGRCRVAVRQFLHGSVAENVSVVLERLPIGVIAFVVRQDKNI